MSWKKLFIAQKSSFSGQILNILRRSPSAIIAFSVGTKLSLEKHGINASFPEDFVPLPDFNAIGVQNYERTNKVCKVLDEKLQEKFLQLQPDLTPVTYSHFRIKVFLDAAYSSYLILKALFNQKQFEETFIVTDQGNLSDLVLGKGSVACSLAERMLRNREGVKSIRSSMPVDYRQFLNNRIGWAIMNSKEKISSHPRSALILDRSHDVSYVQEKYSADVTFFRFYFNDRMMGLYANDGRRYKFDINKNNNRGSALKLDEVFLELSKDAYYRRLFEGDENLFEFIQDCLKDYLANELIPLLPHLGVIKHWLEDIKPEFLLTSHCRLDLKNAFILSIVKSCGIPVITYQEGGGTGYLDWPLFNLDMEFSDSFLVYAEGVKKSLFLKGPAQVIPIGSMRLKKIRDSLNKTQHNNLTVAVVLDSFKMNEYQHYPYNGGFFSQAYKHQLKIIEALLKIEGVDFILKIPKGRRFLYESFAKCPSIKIIDEPLVDVLNDMDAFILEYPSTTFQECLLTDKPVALLYNQDNVRIQQEALDLMRQRAHLTCQLDEFEIVIRNLIKDIKQPNARKDHQGFLNRYCLMADMDQRLDSVFKKNMALTSQAKASL